MTGLCSLFLLSILVYGWAYSLMSITGPTSFRIAWNIKFRENQYSCKNANDDAWGFWNFAMPWIGAYNQSDNNDNGFSNLLWLLWREIK